MDAINTGKILLGTGLSIPSLPVARIQATLGFDFIFIDAEHTPMSPDLIHDIIKVVSVCALRPLLPLNPPRSQTCNYHASHSAPSPSQPNC